MFLLMRGDGDESTWSKIWNSPIVRAYIPDVVGINVGFTNVIWLGYGGSAQLIFLTRGKDVGFHATYAPSVRAGIDVGVSATLISGYYVGDARNATLGSLLGWGGDVSGSFAGITGGIWASQRSGLTPSWVGGDIGFAAGPPIGPKFGVSGGISYTKPIF
jgi:hypothetical protein